MWREGLIFGRYIFLGANEQYVLVKHCVLPSAPNGSKQPGISYPPVNLARIGDHALVMAAHAQGGDKYL